MKRTDFNPIKEQAKKVNVLSDPWFKSMGWFWINLTEKQMNEMIDLIESQGGKPDADGWFNFSNGMTIRRESLI